MLLSDGSQLLLDARSQVNLDFTPAYRQVRLLDGAVTVSVAPDARRPFLVRPPRAPCARSAPVTWCVNRPSAPWWWCMSTKSRSRPCPAPMAPCGRHRRASTPAHGHAARRTDGRSRLGGWLDRRARPAAGRGDRGAAPLPQRLAAHLHGCAGGLPVSGHFPLDDTDAALRSLQESMPIHIRRYTPGTCRSTSRPEPSPSCNVLSSGTVSLYTRHSIFTRIFTSAGATRISRQPRQAARPTRTSRNFPRGSRPEPPPWRSPPDHRASSA